MKNKVGLITFHDTTNFGSLLQTYGLYKKIEDLGYDIEVIDYTCSQIREREIPCFPKIRRNFLKRLVSYLFFSKNRKEKYFKLTDFLNKNMKLSRKINKKEELKELNKDYGNFVCGSDLIWDLKITDNDYSYFLDFVEKEKNIFSFSSAGATWTENQKDKLKQIFINFKNINVRDEGTKDRVQEILPQKSVEITCDPTMLLEKDEWEKHTIKNSISEKYILVYFLDDKNNVLNFTKFLEEKTGIKAYFINNGRKIPGIRNIAPTSIEEFLTLIRNAEYVVTSSYHGLLFSLYFNKKMWFYNRAHKDRMKNIMKRIDIANREIKDGSDYELLFAEKMNYSKINNELNEYREESIKKLDKSLRGD